MNRKQLILSIILLLIVGAIGFSMFKSSKSDWNNKKYSAAGENLIVDLDVNKVAKIAVSSGKDSVTVQRKNETWIVTEKNGYNSDFSRISNFLNGIAETKVIQNINVGKSQLEKLSLSTQDKDSGNAVLVELEDEGGKKMASILLGKKHVNKEESPNPYFGGNSPDGRYLMLLDGKGQVRLVNNPLDEISADQMSWIDKSFYEIDKIKSLELKKANASDSWKIEKKAENENFTLSGLKEGEELDSAKVSGLATILRYASFKDVKPESPDFKAVETVEAETSDGFKYVLSLAPNDVDKYSVNIKVSGEIPEKRQPAADEKAEDKDKLDKEFADKTAKLKEKLEKEKRLGKWIFVLAKNDVDPILKSRKELLKAKEEKKNDKAATPMPLQKAKPAPEQPTE